MFGKALSAIVFMVTATPAGALEIIESNFQHIDPRLGKQLLADSLLPGILLAPISEDWLELSSSNGTIYSSRDRSGGYLAPAVPGNIGGRFILRFEEPVCVVGLQLKSDYPASTERSHFSFVFLDREDESIQELERWPARGTTLQAFSATNTISGFRKVIIDNLDDEAFAFREVRALLCAVPIS